MKTLIQQLQDGKIAICNDGSVEDLRRVLTIAFPKDQMIPAGDTNYYFKSNFKSSWYNCKDSKINLPSHSTSEFIKEIDNKTQVMKTITSEQAQSIIDIACNTWKSTLAKQWSFDIALKNNIKISDDYYQEMRKACTKEQNILFNKIFGPEFKVGDWVTRTKENGGIHKIDRTIQIKKLLGRDSFLAVQDPQQSSHMLSSVRKATPEEIKKAQCYPDGTPCLVRDNHYSWKLAYADGNGKFYALSKKSKDVVNYKQHMKLDIDNLPVN